MRQLSAFAEFRLCCCLLAALVLCASVARADEDPLKFDDTPLTELVKYPPWFKESLLDLTEDLEEAKAANKMLVVYFGQKRCAYCRQLMEVNFKQPSIVKYARDHFDFVPVDIWSPEELTDPHGSTTTQRDYAVALGTNFTPSLVFYDSDGEIALRLRGYYPPYQFQAALEYVAGGHYKRERFPVYLARGDNTLHFDKQDLTEEPFFSAPPFNLDRSRFPADRPLVVFFERGNCHACDILHTEPLKSRSISRLFRRFDNVQLDMNADTPVVTPGGKATTAKKWAKELGIFYTPSLLFFDERGNEITRVDSVVRIFRLRNVLNFVVSKGYLIEKNFLLWRARIGRTFSIFKPAAGQQARPPALTH